MGLLARLFGPREDKAAPLRLLYGAIVARARDPRLYRECGVADSLTGRFDAVTLVLSLVILRMEADPQLKPLAGRLTELFVTDMEGQLRQAGFGDPTVGKRIGKQMMALGGRLGALRAALADSGDAALLAAIDRNVTLNEGADPLPLAAQLRALAAQLAALDGEDLLAGAWQ